MRGTWDGRPATLFDYTYHTWETSTDSNGHTTQHKESHHVAITAVQTDRLYPALSVRPEASTRHSAGLPTPTSSWSWRLGQRLPR